VSKKTKLSIIVISLVVLSGLALSACGAATPEVVEVEKVVTQVVTEKVVETVVVEVEGEEVIKEVEVVKEVVVTATPEPAEAMFDDTAPITIWIDTTRQAAVDKFLEAHPEHADKITVEIVDRGEFPQKVLLFNNVGEGWPDVMFAEPRIVAQVADAAHNYPADLNDWVPQDVIDGFYPGSLDPCVFDGKLFCLRNDLAQDVLYYNKPLMEEFGYEVPTTWDEFLAMSEDVAANHPGYIMGAAGDYWSVAPYFWSSGCPASEVLGVAQVRND